jgi:acyl-CoA thioesterase
VIETFVYIDGIENKITTYDVENPRPGSRQAHKHVAGLKTSRGSNPSLLKYNT